MTKKIIINCDCADPGCPACGGKCQRRAKRALRRIDMDDGEALIAFCDPCAEDAMASGVFDDAGPVYRYARRWANAA